MKYLILCFSIFLLFWFNVSNAQVLPEDIYITLSPNDPAPGEKITATAQSFDTDLTVSKISWYYNGKLVLSGTGKTTVMVTAPLVGGSATLSVVANGVSGDAEDEIVIRPGSVDVIWEAIDSYTPPFYKGKALASIGAKIKAVAIPSANTPKTLSYNWKYNDNSISKDSGVNKNSLVIKTDVLTKNPTFSVDITGGTFEGNGKSSLTLRDPSLVLYQKNNGFIDYAHGSLSDTSISNSGVTLRVEPFNFSFIKSLENSLNIKFTLNGESFSGVEQVQELPIDSPEASGSSAIDISATSIKDRFQSARKTFNLNF